IDEVHAYRGVFGSHVANVIRRLKRISKFYGSNPQFICASATIDNPRDHAERLIGESVALIDNNGAPMGEKHFVFYNPPVVNKQLGIRRSSVLETQKLAGMLLKQGVQTIVFARSRVRVELLLTYLQDIIKDKLEAKTIRGYRGGYLPKLRREIEHGLRTGEIRGVVSTNALELGIDIGQLQACVLNGYPGTVASTWQQSGRAGRRQESSVTRWYWMEQSFPAHNISLRSAAQENFVIIDISNGSRVLGEVDRFSAPTLIHEEAIYIHEGVQYQVEKLDYPEKKAYVREVNVDYYTDANLAVELKVLHVDKEREVGELVRQYGEVTVNAKATIFKKIKLRTHENIGSGPIHLPEEELHTSGYWFSFSEEAAARKSKNEMQYALLGIANVLVHIAPLYLMCDPFDIRVVPQVKAVHTQRPTIYFYDRYPGGIGLSERLYEVHDALIEQAKSVIQSCSCLSGCPACVGPIEEVGLLGKQQALDLLNEAGGTP
ncbi:DEAD/DEAH box helicase, partial [Paenibacillus sp. MCAF20]